MSSQKALFHRSLVLLILCFGFFLLAVPASSEVAESIPTDEPGRAVDLAIVLDVSGSMESLLDAVRVRLWDIIAELSQMQPTPELRVGILTFGSDATAPEAGGVTLEIDLNSDLDTVYQQLMDLRVGGGDEYVGRALHVAIDSMDWSNEWNALRVVFIAGNESADQGVEDFDFRDAAERAEQEDIIINALYVGPREEAIVEKWPEISQLGKGNFSAVSVDTTIQIETPQDAPLIDLNERLNATYVPYGARGKEGLANQIAQDSAASRLGVESCSSRIVAKGGALYNNASWDLVDAALEDDFRWSLVHERDLPEEMRTMSDPERIAYVDAKRAEREAVQLAIQELSAERERFLQETLIQEDSQGLGRALRTAVREQAAARGFASSLGK